jgi:hypothetical protein
MKNGIAALAAASVCALTLGAMTAQGADQGTEVYVYGSYFRCGAAMQADDAVKTTFKGVYDAAVKDGTIKSWAWMAHNTGGDWTRLVFHTAPSIQALYAAADALDKRTSGKDFEKANKQFGQACASHEDYIWRSMAGNVGTARGDAGFSVYYVCDSAREAQADALVTRVFAPTFDKMVADGKITSWGWLEHIIGGKYRRLFTFTAVDTAALLGARGAMNEAMKDDPLSDALTDICGSHSDYIWQVVTKAP